MAVVNFVNSELNANVTTFKDEDGKIWFKAKDVAHALEYVNPGKAVRAHVRDKHKKTFEELQGGSILNPQPQTVFIQEPGVYQLVFSSKLPSAIEFQDWDFEEVIPSISERLGLTLPCALKTIKSITCDDLTALDDDERKEYKQILRMQHNMIKDERKVPMGRRGGLKTQKDIRKTKSCKEKLEII